MHQPQSPEAALENSEIDFLLSALLRGEQPDWPPERGRDCFDSVARRSSFHGVQAMSSALMAGVDWPAPLVAKLRVAAFELAVWEICHRKLISEVVGDLAKAGVPPILFKGTPLAYSLYANPLWRERGDTDILIPPDSLATVEEVLRARGFVRGRGVSGRYVSYQASFTRLEADNPHTVDVHWRINNSQVLAPLFEYDELLERARPVAALGPEAVAASPVDALMLACMHRATHLQNPYYSDGIAYYDGDRMIWLYDVHLLASSFDQLQWQQFLESAGRKGLRSACADGLERSQRRFGSRYPAHLLDSLRARGHRDAGSEYLFSGAARQQWLDFRALPSIRARAGFLRELVFPDAGHMRGKYPADSGRWIGWLYLRRALRGARKKLISRGHQH